MTKQVGLVILVLVLGLAVTGPGFRDQIGPDDDVVPSSHPAIRPLEIVTSSVSRGLASLRSPRAGFNTGEGRRAEIRRAAADLFDVGDIARRALGQHWKGLGSREREEFVALFDSIITTSSVAELLERMRTELSRRAQSPDGVAGAPLAEPETPARGRFAAGLLLGLSAASSPRWR